MTLIRREPLKAILGYIKIRPTLNNIFITLTDNKGNVLISKHAGMLEFTGTKKRTPYVASRVLSALIKDIQKLETKIDGYIIQIHGFIRNSSISSVMKQFSTMRVKNAFYIEYITMRCHNGLRKKKKRRL